ncbi:MAG: DNA repair protein RadA [Bacteroidetes bacterium]|nr:DNA repair protein RadA [Bacteroidota bacterium]
MAKQKLTYRCSECGHTSVQWTGKCASCGQWNTLAQEIVQATKTGPTSGTLVNIEQKITKLGEGPTGPEVRYPSPDPEFNRVLGGGLVQGSLVLVGGKPGIGKSTLMLQLALNWTGKTFLYFSGEESINQVQLRAGRLPQVNQDVYFMADTSLVALETAIEQLNCDVVVVDSIQTLHWDQIESSAGSVVQIRECTNRLMQLAKAKGCAICIIGHITKDGYIAGPKVLEHMVDVVLYFDDSQLAYRFVKSTKNRFGTTSEVGIYEMTGQGLVPVANPSQIFIEEFGQGAPGVAIAPAIEGMRPMLIEVQALISPSFFGTPQRTSNGFDSKRLALLLAVLERHCGLKLGQRDVFLNITGGMKVSDPGIDLAVCAALVSSYYDLSVPKGMVFSGEVGLTGEVRPTRLFAERSTECSRLGFGKYCHSARNDKPKANIGSVPLANIAELVKSVFK